MPDKGRRGGEIRRGRRRRREPLQRLGDAAEHRVGRFCGSWGKNGAERLVGHGIRRHCVSGGLAQSASKLQRLAGVNFKTAWFLAAPPHGYAGEISAAACGKRVLNVENDECRTRAPSRRSTGGRRNPRRCWRTS